METHRFILYNIIYLVSPPPPTVLVLRTPTLNVLLPNPFPSLSFSPYLTCSSPLPPYLTFLVHLSHSLYLPYTPPSPPSTFLVHLSHPLPSLSSSLTPSTFLVLLPNLYFLVFFPSPSTFFVLLPHTLTSLYSPPYTIPSCPSPSYSNFLVFSPLHSTFLSFSLNL